MEEFDRDNYPTKRQIRSRLHQTSQLPSSSVFADDFGDGFGGGKAKVKAGSMVHRSVNTSGPPLLSAGSRPRYQQDTALIMSSAEDSDSADEMNLCGSQSGTQSKSRRAVSRTHVLERTHSSSQNEHGTLQSPVQSARAFGKQRESRVAKAAPSPSKKGKEGGPSRVPNRTVSSSRMPPHRSRSPLRASREVIDAIASTSSSKVPRHQKSSLLDLHSLATPVDNSTEPTQPRKSSRTQKKQSSPPLVMNRLRNEKRNKNSLLTSQERKGTTVSSTDFSSSTRGSGSSRASTRSGRKQFERGRESSLYQLEEVPWADLVHFPSLLAPARPKSSRTGTPNSSQSSSLFPMHLTPPNLRMKKQATPDELDNSISSAPGSGSGQSRKRKLSCMNEAPDLSEDGDVADATMTYSQIIRESDVDPTTLCPFCDDPLPANPSGKLHSQLSYFRETCKSEPRWGNSMGLTASVNVFVGFCALHTAETKIIPQGLRHGWPQEIDFKTVATRVRKLESKLRAVIEDPDGRGATFYGPLKEAAARHGIGAVTGSKGSWNSFERVHAGYGEQGVVIISQILFDLFPSIPGDKVQPFDADFFRSYVLVPEAALLLIREDLSNQPKWVKKVVPRGVAFKVLQKSAAYGKAMFAEEDDTDGVADQAVRQRAKARRKEIEREEEKEAAEQKKQQRNSRARSTALKERDRMLREVGQANTGDDALIEFSDLDEALLLHQNGRGSESDQEGTSVETNMR